MNVGLPAYEQIRDILREEIISGKIPPDTRLKKAEIADRFGVSPMPVREALQWLKGEGLIEGLPHRGYRVISIDIQFIRNIFELRTAMEELMTRLSLPHITDTDIQQMTDINSRLSAIPKNVKIKTIHSLDSEFHRNIYQHCDNPLANEIHKRYRKLVRSLRRKHGFGHTRLSDIIEQHKQIINALYDKNESIISELIRKHRIGAMEDLLQRIRDKE